MTRYATILNPSLTDAEGHSKFLNRLFSSGVALAFNANGWKVTQRGAGANMSVDVAAGDGLLNLPSTAYCYWGWTDATENVAVTTANPTNPRIDTVVAWIDTSVTTTVSANSPGALKFQIMAGTPAGSPVAMSDVTIQSTLGAGVAWIKLATFTVAAGSTSVVNANISDARVAVTGLANSAVADGSIATAKLAAASVTAAKIDFTTGIWWEELGRATLVATASSISIPSIPVRKYLKVILNVTPTGGTIAPAIRFNNDATNSYAGRHMSNGSTATNTSISFIYLDVGGAVAEPHCATVEVLNNIASQEKMMRGLAMRPNGSGAGIQVPMFDMVGKWANAVSQINRVDVISSAGTGQFAAGSEVIVLGHN